MLYTMPIIIGFILDVMFGDPHSLPHPVRLMGVCITRLTDKLRSTDGDDVKKGKKLVFFMLGGSFLAALLLVILFYVLFPPIGAILEGILCYYCLAARSLFDESMKVYNHLKDGYISDAKADLSMIVGRDTANLEEDGIVRAAVETVAENTSDGVTAPLFYMMIGGAPLAFLYKAANTMDSMVGYKTEEYINYGRAAAKTDDFLNYIPSRLTALFMCAAAAILKMDAKSAYRIWKRDGKKHESPNSAQTEAACAGALGVQLGGDAYYGGELHHREFIGDDKTDIHFEDIKEANKLMYATSGLFLIAVCIVRAVVITLISMI